MSVSVRLWTASSERDDPGARRLLLHPILVFRTAAPSGPKHSRPGDSRSQAARSPPARQLAGRSGAPAAPDPRAGANSTASLRPFLSARSQSSHDNAGSTTSGVTRRVIIRRHSTPPDMTRRRLTRIDWVRSHRARTAVVGLGTAEPKDPANGQFPAMERAGFEPAASGLQS